MNPGRMSLMGSPRLRKDKPPRTALGERLRALRLERNLQQQELARNAGVNPIQYGRYERGDTMPTAEVLKRLARTLGVSGDYLMDGASESAAKADFADRELLHLFEEVATFSEKDKEAVKNILDALVLRKRLHGLTGT